MAAAEISPFAKAGGLADVVGSLPPALKKLGCDARLIMPLYGAIERKKFKLKKIRSNVPVISNNRQVKINIWKTKLPTTSVIVYFIEQKQYFGAKEIYAKKNNAERFLFFSLATLHILPIIKFKPDIIHCHDFHTALIPDLLKVNNWTYLKNVKTIYTIHNLNYQGNSEIETLKTGNLTKNSLKSLSKDAKDGDINFMVQGILNADLVTTVSKTYAKEIATSIYGARLDNIIKKRRKDLYGILNGIDTKFYDPAKDEFIKTNYSIKTLNKKIENKLYLQKKLNLPQNKNIALVGMVSRLVWQKGLELITEQLAGLNCQFVILGTGQKKYEKHLKTLAKKYPNKFSARIMFDTKLAQEIYAGADIFLMPSRFEPCGLGQMIAMRYGAVPLVRATGGLADTVRECRMSNVECRIKKGTGFVFKNFSVDALYNKLRQALNIYYRKPKLWRRLQINGMEKDFSWDKSAKEYLKLYKLLA
jgi:starch synthase